MYTASTHDLTSTYIHWFRISQTRTENMTSIRRCQSSPCTYYYHMGNTRGLGHTHTNSPCFGSVPPHTSGTPDRHDWNLLYNPELQNRDTHRLCTASTHDPTSTSMERSPTHLHRTLGILARNAADIAPIEHWQTSCIPENDRRRCLFPWTPSKNQPQPSKLGRYHMVDSSKGVRGRDRNRLCTSYCTAR